MKNTCCFDCKHKRRASIGWYPCALMNKSNPAEAMDWEDGIEPCLWDKRCTDREHCKNCMTHLCPYFRRKEKK